MVECQVDGCTRRAKFNFVGSEEASHCDKHKVHLTTPLEKSIHLEQYWYDEK